MRGFRLATGFLFLSMMGGSLFGQTPVAPQTTTPTEETTGSPVRPAGAATAAASPYQYVPGEILVRYRDTATSSRRNSINAQAGIKVLSEFSLVRGLQLVKLPEGMTVATALSDFRQNPEVLYAEPNYIVHTMAKPNDTYFSQQWGLSNTGARSGSVAGADIDAPAAWNLTTGSKEAVLAVIDTGIDYAHPDLAANVFRNEKECGANANAGRDDDGNGYVDDCYGIDVANNDSDPLDDNGHGTHVSGILGAVGNNNQGIAGVNWKTRILSCKFFDEEGYGDIAGAVKCLEYIADMKDRGVNIVASNNSWGGGAYTQTLYDAIDKQRQKGILFITAAGNDFLDNDTLQFYPCSYHLPNIVCVAATTAADALYHSNYSKRLVHIGAPGADIYSTIPQGSYGTMGGTSMATAFVTGTAGLLYAQYPKIGWMETRNRIRPAAIPLALLIIR